MPSVTDFEWRGPPMSPHPMLPIGQVVLDALRKNAATVTTPAQVEAATGSCKTYADLLRDWVQAAAGWRALGVGAKDSLAVFSKNSHLSYAAVMGAVMEGVTLATIAPAANEGDAQHVLHRFNNIRAMLCDPDNLQVALRVLPQGAVLVVAAERTDVDGALTVAELARGNVDVDAYRAADVGDILEHVAIVLSSSGTTGPPKAVMVSNYAVTANTITSPKPERGDVVLVTPSLSWVTGLFQLLLPTLGGATKVIYNYTNASECLAAMCTYKVSKFYLPSPRHCQLADHIRTLRDQGVAVDLPHLRAAMSGGAPMSAELQRLCSAALGANVLLGQNYGSTELLLTSFDAAGAQRRHGSVGRLAAGVRAKLVDTKSGEPIRVASKEGELRIKSEFAMKGYMGDEAATAQALDEDGWYRTGDLAKFDEDGYLFITDRIKELLSFMGETMVPSEIEDVLRTHPGVRAVCVVGRHVAAVGNLPTAFVELRAGQTASEKDIKEFAHARLSNSRRLRGGVFFLDKIPSMGNGKYERKLLRESLGRLPPTSDIDISS